MNRELKISPYTLKGRFFLRQEEHGIVAYFCLLVGAGNVELCSDSFISKQNIIVNALDNVEARRYMDSFVLYSTVHHAEKYLYVYSFRRCVTNKKPLLESGTMGPKGHTFVVIPFKSECYSNQVRIITNNSMNRFIRSCMFRTERSHR